MQPSLRESVRPEVCLRLPAELERVDAWLDDERFFAPFVHRETKTHASDATLPLPGICVTASRQRLADADDARPAAGSAWRHTGLVFGTMSGTPIDPRNVNRSWDTQCAKAGSGRSPCTTPAAPAPRCWPTWMFPSGPYGGGIRLDPRRGIGRTEVVMQAEAYVDQGRLGRRQELRLLNRPVTSKGVDEHLDALDFSWDAAL